MSKSLVEQIADARFVDLEPGSVSEAEYQATVDEIRSLLEQGVDAVTIEDAVATAPELSVGEAVAVQLEVESEARDEPLPQTSTDALRRASARLRGDWDAGGTVSVYLPANAAVDMLDRRGWRFDAEAWGGTWVAPSGSRYFEIGEALQVALLAEVV